MTKKEERVKKRIDDYLHRVRKYKNNSQNRAAVEKTYGKTLLDLTSTVFDKLQGVPGQFYLLQQKEHLSPFLDIDGSTTGWMPILARLYDGYYIQWPSATAIDHGNKLEDLFGLSRTRVGCCLVSKAVIDKDGLVLEGKSWEDFRGRVAQSYGIVHSSGEIGLKPLQSPAVKAPSEIKRRLDAIAQAVVEALSQGHKDVLEDFTRKLQEIEDEKADVTRKNAVITREKSNLTQGHKRLTKELGTVKVDLEKGNAENDAMAQGCAALKKEMDYVVVWRDYWKRKHDELVVQIGQPQASTAPQGADDRAPGDISQELTDMREQNSILKKRLKVAERKVEALAKIDYSGI